MTKRDRQTLTRMRVAARVLSQVNGLVALNWARQNSSREMKRIIMTAFGK